MAIRVTFMIGNGFDLNLGLNTKYQDFYPHYLGDVRFHTEDPEILQFKELLRSGCNYSHWADFELALGQHTNDSPLNSEASLRKCLQNFNAASPNICRKRKSALTMMRAAGTWPFNFSRISASIWITWNHGFAVLS